MTSHNKITEKLKQTPQTWLVTGAAGFIGSHLTEALLKLDQYVIGFDNFTTGTQANLDTVQHSISATQWRHFSLVRGDIRNPKDCARAFHFSGDSAPSQPVTYVLHHAALASVPESIKDPLTTHDVNVTGFLNILEAARKNDVSRIVYASSSAVYGDDPAEQKSEGTIGYPLSPYATSKRANELYGLTYNGIYNMKTIGLRYFNIYGMRQDPNGPYAAVIPRWISNLTAGNPVEIYGDGQTTRDFCFISDVVQANIRAACVESLNYKESVFNIGTGTPLSLNVLYDHLKTAFAVLRPGYPVPLPKYSSFRAGDIQYSCANILKARKFLGYAPDYTFATGLQKYLDEGLSFYQNRRT